MGKVVFVYLFGNTCGPCKAIAPTVEASIYKEFKDHAGFAAVGLDVWDHSSDATSVRGFKNATGVTFPLAILGGKVATTYGMVIDQNGILVHKGQIPVSNDLNSAIEAITVHLNAVGLGGPLTKDSELKVFPVPASDVVNFEAQGSITGIRLYDVTGKLVLEETYGLGNASNSRTVSLETIDQGVFIYTLLTNGSRIPGKLLIQR